MKYSDLLDQIFHLLPKTEDNVTAKEYILSILVAIKDGQQVDIEIDDYVLDRFEDAVEAIQDLSGSAEESPEFREALGKFVEAGTAEILEQ